MEATLVKIAEYKLRQYGERGVSVSLPRVFALDNGLEFGDTMELFRGNVDGKDALIIFPKQGEVKNTEEQIAEAI